MCIGMIVSIEILNTIKPDQTILNCITTKSDTHLGITRPKWVSDFLHLANRFYRRNRQLPFMPYECESQLQRIRRNVANEMHLLLVSQLAQCAGKQVCTKNKLHPSEASEKREQPNERT